MLRHAVRKIKQVSNIKSNYFKRLLLPYSTSAKSAENLCNDINNYLDVKVQNIRNIR